MQRPWLIVLLFALLVPVPVVAGSESQGKAVRILDGDTIEVLSNKHSLRIRLSGIDCSEKGQAFGNRAKQAMSALVFGKDVIIQSQGQDKDGRTLAEVLLPDGTHVKHELVKEGWCWWYQKYAPKDLVMRQLEQEARAQKKGLWSKPHPVPPWLYRRLRAGAYP